MTATSGIKLMSPVHNGLSAEAIKRLLQPHKIAYYFFVFVDSGSTTYKVDMKEYTVSDSQLLFVLPNQVITPPSTKPDTLKYYKIRFDENTLALLPQPFPFLVNPLNTRIIQFDEATRQRVRAIFEILDQLLHTTNKQPETRIILAHLNTLLTEFDTAYFKDNDHLTVTDPRLSKYIEFKLMVETHLTEQHFVHAIADELALTTNSLYALVKDLSGVSPKEYITNRLMLEAQRKLHYSNSSVKEVAYELGFNDPAYFSRLFKKSTGKSVTDYLAERKDLSGK
jgi:AraC family transcriptional regulator, transcriptional activator of pobA